MTIVLRQSLIQIIQRAGVLGSVLIAIMFLLTGCPSHVDPLIDPDSSTNIDIPSYEQLAVRHHARLDAMKTLVGRGVVEMRWIQDGEPEFIQGDIRLWLLLPDRISLRVEKLDDVYLWLGSDSQKSWVFDLYSEPTSLTVTSAGESDLAETDLPVSPDSWLFLSGLEYLPESPDPPAAVTLSTENNAWMVSILSRRVIKRLYFDRSNGLPVRAEIEYKVEGEAESETASIQSELRQYLPVELRDSPPGAWPKFPRMIDVIVDAQTTAKIALEAAPLDLNPPQQVFDLDRLLQALQPQKIDDRRLQPRINSK